jgi:hypothetical protein
LIVIEVHPYNWHLFGGSSDSLLRFLHACGYEVTHLNGTPATTLSDNGHVLAVPPNLRMHSAPECAIYLEIFARRQD